MSVINEQIRQLAARVAVSHGLDLVDLEFQGGGGKHRTLRIFLERNAEGRAALRTRLAELRPEHDAETADAEAAQAPDDGVLPESEARATDEAATSEVSLDLVAAGEIAGLTEDEDELAHLRNLPSGVPIEQLSGITHGDCERFSRDFGTALDVEELIPGAEYILEVSSPGLDRKLSRVEDFERFHDQLCAVQTFTAVDGSRKFTGRIATVADGNVTLTPDATKKAPKKKKGTAPPAQPVTLAISNIEKAQLVPEF